MRGGPEPDIIVREMVADQAKPIKMHASISAEMSDTPSNAYSTTLWSREIASSVFDSPDNDSLFRRIWLQPAMEQAEQGFLAACYEQLARRANSDGEYYLAHDAANHGLRCAAASEFPPHVLISAKVTALARSGATGNARRVMEEFLQTHAPNSGVSSSQARLFRDLGLAASDPIERRSFFKEAALWAAKAKEYSLIEGDAWAYPANQEAQFQLLAGERDLAESLALKVIEYVNCQSDSGSMWNQTNLAEMHFVRGDIEKAGFHYRKAAELGSRSPGDLASNRAVAAVLFGELREPNLDARNLLENWFPKPLLLVFAGHMPDASDRSTPRLPRTLCRPGGKVAQALRDCVKRLNPIEGICATAPGGDIMFAEAVLANKVRLSLVDPFPRARNEKVAANYGEDWPERLSKVFREARRSEAIACAEDADEAAQCEYSNRVMLGGAMLRARRVNANLLSLVLWDESDADSPKRGGTGEFVALCRSASVPVEVFNPHCFSP